MWEGKKKRRKCWLPTFSPFPTVFSKGFYFKVIKGRDCVVKILPFPKQQILDSSKFKESADDDFKVDENGRKFYKWIEKDRIIQLNHI